MKPAIHIRTLIAVLAVAALLAGCGGEARREPGPETAGPVHEHDEEALRRDGETNDYEGDAHHDDEDAVTLSPEAMRLAGIRLARIAPVSIERTIELPGEIAFNDERQIHITPRYAGVIRDVRVRVGTRVKEGEVLAVIESNVSLSTYAVTAPIAGTVVRMHASLGEFVAEDRDLFVVADLSTVWAECEAFAEDLPALSVGQKMTIRAVRLDAAANAVISYISSDLNEGTRAAVVRAVIPGGEIWRPGVFIRGTIHIPVEGAVPAVVTDAVQLLGETKVIFVEGDEPGEFRPVPVKTGRGDGTFVELLEGPPVGSSYVAEGAFDLKAQIVTREAGAHAGHGH